MNSNCGLMPRRHALSLYLGILGGAAITAALVGCMQVPATAARATTSGDWGRPHELSRPHGVTGVIEFTTLSCTSRSNCTAVGYYQGRSGLITDFAVTERRGVWGKALSFAAPAAGKRAEFGGVPVLSCASAGNCVAGDSYGHSAFVFSEVNGTWRKARQVPDSPDAISCLAPGDCTAALARGYLLSEMHGTWLKAFPVPGLAALRHGQPTSFGVISCPSPGNCTAAGSYYDPAVSSRSFVVTERHGTWSNAQPVTTSQPGTGLNITALSCPSVGNCVAAGYAYLPANEDGAFAVTEAHGNWGTAKLLPGTVKPPGDGGGIDGLDCSAVGACNAFGDFTPNGIAQPFVSTERNGTWHAPQAIPGVDRASSNSISCAAPGSCIAIGATVVRRGGEPQAATAEEVNGRWGPARALPGILAIDHGYASALEALSCPPRSRCTAVGSFGALFATVQR